MTESDNYHDGSFTRWIAALSAAPRNLEVPATWKTTVPKGPPLPGEVPDEA